MLVILSALGGLLESDPREIYMTGNQYRVPVLDTEFDHWKCPVFSNCDVIYTRIATFEHRGKYRSVGDKTVIILELVDYSPKQTEASPKI
jgi:hypothetical protein